ncbi:FadR/GntR family transcriptional regulator [Paenibacillus sp. V4I5]|uniref:FadR/GntR family transcriptional regulator n=1 Tax=Paenibacillus sp. V4I5 TaxID=3042306 RepID=UPI0027943B7E|nr:FadR/GntR family transcriptional regulator [Paenibacillus sp. V4I5]MDQ0919761.1 GntR family transcriptional repressor for pyruvate dehydrogenase complex [Paenibacillus sp. V4I5]
MPKIQKYNVHELVAQEIQRYIEENALKEGDKLPSAGELTAMFGVGRSSLREALRYLEAVDIVRVENGKGIFVRDVDTFRFTGKVKVENEKKFLLSILDVRRALEGKAVELSARNINANQLKELEKILHEYKRLKESGKDTSQIDLAFHQHIIKSSGNPILESVINSMSGLYQKFFNDPLGEKRLFDETYPFHHTIYEGISQHDPERATGEFHQMMDCIEKLIKTY